MVLLEKDNIVNEINKESLLKDEQFLDDATAFLVDRGGYSARQLLSAESIYDKYMEHFRFQNVNEATAISDMIYAQGADEEEKERMARLMDTYDNMDSDFGLKAIGDYAAGIAFAPSTYAGIVTGGGAKIGALAAQQGVKLGIREVLKRGVAGEALRKAATAGIVRAGAVEGVLGAGQVAAQEETRVETGMQEDIRGGAVALGGALSVVPGAVFGAGQQLQRAITSNVAERTSKITKYKKSKELKAKQVEVDKVFEDSETGDMALEIFQEVQELGSDKKVPFSKTIPEELKEGKKLREDLSEPVTIDELKLKLKLASDIETQTFKSIAAVGAKLSNMIPDMVVEGGGVERVGSKITRALMSGAIETKKGVVEKFDANSLVNIADKYGISIEQLAPLWAASVSEGMAKGGVLSGISKRAAKEQLKKLDNLDRAMLDAASFGDVQMLTRQARDRLNEVENVIGKSHLEKAMSVMGNIAKARVGLMTIQLATTSRNISAGYLRNLVYGFDNLGQGLYNQAMPQQTAKRRLKQIGNYEPTDEEIKEETLRAVNLGKAQMRTFVDSLAFKDLMTVTTAETTALAKLMKDPDFGKSKAAQKLFLDMGHATEELDKGDTFLDKGLFRAARLGNKLNTMSDNMFKRAILGRELNKSIRATGAKIDRVGLGTASQVFKNEEAFNTYKLENPWYVKVKNNIAKDAVLGTDELKQLSDKITFKSLNNLDLNQLLKTGRFTDIDDEVIARGMTEALDFTYQTSDFGTRAGGFNKFATFFIDTFQTPLGSAFVPFPRYMINQFRFMYEHAPILGTLNLGGIKNVAGSATGKYATKPFLDLGAESVAKQMTGLMTVGAFFGLRSTFGDETTGPFQYENPYGSGTVNAEALLGPFTAHALLADAFYRIQNSDKVNEPIEIRNFIKAVGGGQFRGTGLNLVDNVADTIQSGIDDGQTTQQISDATAKLLGNYLNSFTVGAGVLKDVVATLDPDFRTLPNNTDVKFIPYMLKQATRSFPQAVDDDASFYGYTGLGPKRDRLESATRTTGVRSLNPFMRQITGLGQEEERNLAEKEFDRLGIKWFEIQPTKIKGDTDLTNKQKLYMAEHVEKDVTAYIAGDEEYYAFKNEPMIQKSLVKQQIAKAKAKAKALVYNKNVYEVTNEIDRFAKITYLNKLSDVDKAKIEMYYKQETVSEKYPEGIPIGDNYLAALYIAEELGLYTID